MFRLRWIGALVGIVWLSGCMKWAGTDPSSRVQTELYFGMKGPKEQLITDSSFRKFIVREVSSRFPQGYTLRQAEGQWRMNNGTLVSEPSRLLTLVHPRTPYFSRQIDTIANLYCHQFQQEAVMRISRKVQAAFPDGQKRGMDTSAHPD